MEQEACPFIWKDSLCFGTTDIPWNQRVFPGFCRIKGMHPQISSECIFRGLLQLFTSSLTNYWAHKVPDHLSLHSGFCVLFFWILGSYVFLVHVDKCVEGRFLGSLYVWTSLTHIWLWESYSSWRSKDLAHREVLQSPAKTPAIGKNP